jgi:hypothetical protein
MPRRLRIGYPRSYRMAADRSSYAMTGQDASFARSEQVGDYDLYATDTNGVGTIPFAVNWPAEPASVSTTVDVTAGNASSLSNALLVNNATINVPAGTYSGSFTVTGSDQIILLDDEAVIAGGLTVNHTGSAARVRWEGGVIDSIVSNVAVNNARDFLMRNVNANVREVNCGVGTQSARRCAFIHNTIYAQRTGFFTPGASAFQRLQDIILAGNYISGGMTVGNSGVESAIRIQSTDRTIIVDNRLRCGFDGQSVKHTIRSHYGNADYFVRNALTEYGDHVYIKPIANDTVDDGTYAMGDHWFYDLFFYNTGGGPTIANAFRDDVKAISYPGRLTVNRGTAYRSIQTNPAGVNVRWTWNAQAGDSIANCLEYPYQAPPSLGSWLVAAGQRPGADH